jgi:phage-related protein
MSNIIDATLRFVDKFTSPMNNAIKSMEKSARQAQRMGKEIEKAGKNISNVGSGLTASITLPVAAAGVACFEAASDMSESLNKVDVAFGKNADSVKKWSDTTLESYGIAKGTALDMAATYGDMATGMGLSTDQASKMSQSLVGLAGDLASFKNISIDTANTALKGIYTGEGESLKTLGIIMTDTTLQAYALEKGLLKSTVSQEQLKEMSTKVSMAQSILETKIKKYGANSLEAEKAQLALNTAVENQAKAAQGSYKDLTQAEKVQLRYNYVMDKAKNSIGDFGRTSNGAANQQRIFSEGLKELAANIGTKLLPAGTKVLQWGNSMISKFSKLSDSQLELILKIAGIAAVIGPAIFIFGKLVTGVGSAVATFGRVAGAIKKAGSVMALITSPAGIVIMVIAGIALATFLLIKNWDKVKAFFIKFGSTIKSIFQRSGVDVGIFSKLFQKAKEVISNAIANLKPAIDNIIKFLKPIINFVSKVFVASFKIGFSAIGGLVSGFVNGITGVISGLLTIFNGITTFIGGIFTGNWSKALEGIKKIFGGIFESLVTLAKTPINMIIGLINGVTGAINKMGFKIPDWVPLLGGKEFKVNIPQIPMLAKGTSNWGGGTAMIHDKGAEILDLPRGTRVYPHDKSIAMARAEGKKSVKVIIKKIADRIEVRSEKDIDTIVDKVADKLEKVLNNMGEVQPT